jgi:hypothetical protein
MTLQLSNFIRSILHISSTYLSLFKMCRGHLNMFYPHVGSTLNLGATESLKLKIITFNNILKLLAYNGLWGNHDTCEIFIMWF